MTPEEAIASLDEKDRATQLALLVQAASTLAASLTEVRKRFDNGAVDWEYSLLRTLRFYLLDIGIEPELVHPLMRMELDKVTHIRNEARKNEGKGGQPLAPLGKHLAFAMAAAAVTVLKERHECDSVADAASKVARKSGLDKKQIQKFRDNVNSALHPPDTMKAYKQYLERLRNYPSPDMLKAIECLTIFVR
jgi:hypothetical protein